MNTYARGVGALYGSATAYMLYDNGTTPYSRSLPGLHDPRLRNHLRDVLRWVWGSMPNLRYVLCLGEVAWYLSMEAANLHRDTHFRQLRDGDRADDRLTGMVGARELIFIPSFHPAARCKRDQKERGWRKLTDAINSDKNA
jgi:uracil-DNA glycosylase